jgi:CRISPR-associated protein (TIGR02584 family)
LTTSRGRESIRRELFADGVWHALRDSLGVSAGELCFGDTADSIRVFTNAHRVSELDDIASTEDGAAVGDFILENLRQFTETPDVRVTCSLAGGRKTMSALAALSMTLLGRAEDTLCHVLVEPPFDDPALRPKFHFPQGRSHTTREGSTVADSQAAIRLHEIPFVRCRNVFRREYGRLPGTFADTVRLANNRLEEEDMPAVRLAPGDKWCQVDGKPIKLSDDEFDTFWMLLERAIEGEDSISSAYVLYTELCQFIERKRDQKMPPVDDTREAHMRRIASRIKGKLNALGSAKRIDLLFPSRDRGCYRIALPANRIEIV